MDIDTPVGTYVVAVSGGVDSIALLDLLVEREKLAQSSGHKQSWRFIVAHYDHGIRSDSAQDRKLVQVAAKKYDLPFVYDTGDLGPSTSEAKAREARYAFLHKVRTSSGARGIITAHHKDDATETAILQILRGTSRRGLASLNTTDLLYRPLLHVPKRDLIAYAKSKKLPWREDSTNVDTRYLRNRVRHLVLPKMTHGDRQKLDDLVANMRRVNKEIDALLDVHLHVQPSTRSLDKKWFLLLPHKVAVEVMAYWLRRQGILSFDKKLLENLVVNAKTLAVGQFIDVDKSRILRIKKNVLALEDRDR